MENKLKNKALFLDRDGIINVDKTYVYKFDDIEWMPGIIELITFANKNGFKVIVLTNQSGIERGYYKNEDVLQLHQKMSAELANLDAQVDDWFFCSSLDSEDRKPNPGMMLKATQLHQIDLTKSFMIGDKTSDIINLKGPKYLLLKGKYPLDNISDDVIVLNDLFEMKSWLQKQISLR